MARKKRTPKPESEVETPLEKGTFVWVAPNLPTHAAYLCGCGEHRCNEYIWGRGLAVRDQRGVYRTLGCAIRGGITTRAETEAAFPELLRLKGVPTKEEREAAEAAKAAEEKKRKKRKTAPPKKPAEKPKIPPRAQKKPKAPSGKPRLPAKMAPRKTTKKTIVDLAEDALANAPEHVRRRLAKRQNT